MTLTNLLPLIIFSLFLFFAWAVTARSSVTEISNGNRFDYIDGLRGIAAVGVVATHFWRITPSGSGVSFLFEGRANYGPLGVQIFFCITGFLFFGQMIHRRGEFSWDVFYRSRVRRIVPGYLVFYVLGVMAVIIYGDVGKASFGQLANIVDMAFMGFAGKGEGKVFAAVHLDLIFGVIWTLKYEILFYTSFPFVVYFIARVGVGAGFAIIFAIVMYELARTGETFFGYFLTGGVAYLLARKFSPPIAVRLVFGFFILFLVFYLIYSSYPSYGWERFLLASLLFLLIALCKPKILSSRPLRLLGDISYSMYLLHAPILIVNRVFFRDVVSVGHYGGGVFILVTFVGVMTVFVLSLIQYKYIELPFIRKSSIG